MTNEQHENEMTTVVINPSNPVNVVAVDFYREEVITICTVGEDDNCKDKPKYVHSRDKNDTACTVHRMEIIPRIKREYVKIEDVPSKLKSSEEMLAEALNDELELHEPEYVTVDDDELGDILKTPQS